MLPSLPTSSIAEAEALYMRWLIWLCTRPWYPMFRTVKKPRTANRISSTAQVISSTLRWFFRLSLVTSKRGVVFRYTAKFAFFRS